MESEYSVGPGGSTEVIEEANVHDGMLFIPAYVVCCYSEEGRPAHQ
jgi:hypothetical protein